MECTHIHTPMSKVKTVLVNKGNKKLFLPVKNKTNLSTNWKTKLKQGAKWGIKHCKHI